MAQAGCPEQRETPQVWAEIPGVAREASPRCPGNGGEEAQETDQGRDGYAEGLDRRAPGLSEELPHPSLLPTLLFSATLDSLGVVLFTVFILYGFPIFEKEKLSSVHVSWAVTSLHSLFIVSPAWKS